MIFRSSDQNCFWWSCFWWCQHFRSTLSSEPLFFRCFMLPTCWFHCSHLFFHKLYFKETLNFCLWSCILEQILAYLIDNFVIPCYHQNSKGNVKHILFQQSWFEIVLPRFCNLFTIWVNLIFMEEMVSPCSMRTRVLIFDCLTLSVPSWRVSNASHIALAVLQWETEWYPLTPREEMRISRAFKSYCTFFFSSSFQSALGLYRTTLSSPSTAICG